MSNKVEFEISSGLKDIIGKELITDEYVAIFEIVKNSYDANASKVTIIFENLDNDDKSLAKIIIIDDGDGMSYDDIKKKWLFVGYSAKKIDSAGKYIEKNKKHRVFAGSKGIGRFSVDRLGSQMKLYTKVYNNPNIHLLEINWEKFEIDQINKFNKIPILYSNSQEIPKTILQDKPFMKGTIIEIYQLNDKWDRKNLLKLKNYLCRLIDPQQIPRNQKFNIKLIVDNEVDQDNKENSHFKIVNGTIENYVFKKLNIKTTQIICDVTKKLIITKLVDKGKEIFEIQEKNIFNLHDIHIEISYLNREAKNVFTRIMGLRPVRFGTVFLYKNGFRIHPYGDAGNDWLGLEQRKTQGYARYLSTREIIGSITINGTQPFFKEVSSRSGGIIHTTEYNYLIKLFMEKVLRRLEKYVIEGIDWDKTTGGKSIEEIHKDSINIISQIVGQIDDENKKITFNSNLIEIFKKREIENLPQLIKTVEQLLNYSPQEIKNEHQKLIRSLKKVSKNLTAGMRNQNDLLEKKNKQILFLTKSLTPTTKIEENYHHTIRIITGYIESSIGNINTVIRNKGKIEDLFPDIDLISYHNGRAISLLTLIRKSNVNLQTAKITKDVVEFIKQYLEETVRILMPNIHYSFQNHYLTHVMKFKPLDFAMMLDNFVNNADKAGATFIKISFEKINTKLKILIADNGNGVNLIHKDHIFERGYTTTSGSGIGLNHIKTIIETYDGTLKFLGNNIKKLGTGACFEVTLN